MFFLCQCIVRFRLQKLIIIICLTAAVATADSVGDFAPLEVGNVWVYTTIFEDNTGYGTMPYHADSSFLTIELLKIEEINDTITYTFKNNVSGKIITNNYIFGTLDYDTTYYSDSVYFDTLYEFEGTITNNHGNLKKSTKGVFYPPTLPVSEKNEFDTTSLMANEKLILKDGVFEYERWGGYAYSSKMRYRAGIGLCSDSGWFQNHGWGSIATTLLSFSQNGKIISVIEPDKQKITTVTSTMGSAKSILSLPYVNVVKGNRMFNLLGRVTKGNGRLEETSHKLRIVNK